MYKISFTENGISCSNNLTYSTLLVLGVGGGGENDDMDLMPDGAFKTTWWSVLSVDNCCQVTSLSIDRTNHYVLLKASCCLRSLISGIQ